MATINARTALRNAAIAILVLDAVRLPVHWLLFRDASALTQIAALDLGALVLLAVAVIVTPSSGTFFGSLTFSAVALGVPLALLGYATEKLGSHHLANMMGCVGLLGAGAGMCAASVTRRALAVFGLIALAAGTYFLVNIHQTNESLLIAAPAWATAAWAIVWASRSNH
jgi:hypothetical protein